MKKQPGVRDLHRRRIMSHSIWHVFLVVVLLAFAVFPLSGCGHNDENPPTEPTDKSNPNLSGLLKRLISAEERGEAEEFALQRGIELIDGSVTVIIECESGQAEAVVEAAGTLGNVELIVRDWSRWLYR